jgi:hypothetical protein
MFTWVTFEEQAANADRAASRSAIPNEYRTAASYPLQLHANPGRVILVSHRWPRQRPERNPPLTAENVKFLAAGDRGSAVARDIGTSGFGLIAHLHRDIGRGLCAPLPPGYQPKETTDESDRNT